MQNEIFHRFLAKIEKLGLKPVKELLGRLGGWPVVSKHWDEFSWTWQDAITKLRQFGFLSNYLFDLSVVTDLKNSTKRIISVSILT